MSGLPDADAAPSAPLVSVVMCAYGVEDFIADAMGDVLAQTDPDWELIVVDDGSPDGSAGIARGIAAGEPRVRVVAHAANRGLSAARNTGIAAARGRYVWIPDPDDRFDHDVIERVRASLAANEADLVVFGMVEEYHGADGSLSYEHAIVPTAATCADADGVRREVLPLEEQTLFGYANNKFVRRALLKGLAYKEGVSLSEDFFFNIELIERVNSLNVLACAPYHYQKRVEGSLTSRFTPAYYDIHRRRIELLRDHLASWGLLDEQARSSLGALYARYIVSALERNCDPRAGMDRHARLAWARAVTSDGLFNELIPGARAQGSRALTAAISVLNTRNASLCCSLGAATHLARLHGGSAFSREKSKR